MQGEGSGRSGRHYGDEQEVLDGVLASEYDSLTVVYPADECLACLREGKVEADERCFHRHWRVADRPGVAERRG